MRPLKFIACLAASLSLGGCLGHTSSGNELTGQVKRVQHNTPWGCWNWVHADISLGTMRNGVGSLSSEDIWLWVKNEADVKLLEQAARDGSIVKINYDVARMRGWFSCEEKEEITHVEILR